LNSIYHTWGKLQTPWSKAGVIGITGLAGIYAGIQAVNIYRSLRNLYDSIFNPMPTFEVADTSAAA